MEKTLGGGSQEKGREIKTKEDFHFTKRGEKKTCWKENQRKSTRRVCTRRTQTPKGKETRRRVK